MKFTDEDLERLKSYQPYVGMGEGIRLHPEDLQALLARLEAAEFVCDAAHSVLRYAENNGDRHKLIEDLGFMYQEWRKAAGKAPS
jgi:hypothetical protein